MARDVETNLRRGYYLAVANLVRLYDQPSMVADLLKQYGPVDWSGIDEMDRTVLEPHLSR